jgi:iron complex transport system permease protein
MSEKNKSKSLYFPLKSLIYPILLIILILTFLLDIALGSAQIPLNQVITVLLGEQPEKIAWTTIK